MQLYETEDENAIKINKKPVSLFLLLLALTLALTGSALAAEKRFERLEDFSHARLGILTGSSYDALAKKHFPEAERLYYSLITDLVLAAEQGKIDGFLSEGPYVTATIWEGAKIRAIEEAIDHTNAGFIFQKGEQSSHLREQMDRFIINAR